MSTERRLDRRRGRDRPATEQRGAGSGPPDQYSWPPREPRGFLRAVVEATGDAVLVVNEDFDILWASRSTQRFSGWTPEQLQFTNIGDYVHPDHIEDALRAGETLRNPNVENEPVLITQVRFSSGEYRWVLISGDNRLGDPDVGGMVLVMADHQVAVEARAELDKVTRRHAALLRHSSDCLFVSATDLSVSYVSPAMHGLLGWKPADLMGRKFRDHIVEKDRDAFTVLHAASILKPESSHKGVVRAFSADGGTKLLEVTMTARIDDPDIKGVISNLRDVTERDRLVRELADSNSSLRNLAFSSSTGLFEEDSTCGITSVNPRFSEITGLSSAAVVGRDWRSIIGSDFPFAPLQSAEPVDREKVRFRMRRVDGQMIWVDARSTVLPHDSKGVKRRIGGFEDVTEVVEAEQARSRFVEVFDETDDLMLLLDAEGEIIYANQAATEALGDKVHHLAQADELSAVGVEVERDLMDGGGTHWKGETTITDRNGRELPVSLKVMAHRNLDGRIEFFSAIGRDISERIALEGTLELQARHDPLTGLPNRVLLLERLNEACADVREEGSGKRLALLFVDIDHFKVINDSLGHSLGDELLQEIGTRIGRSIGAEDVVARFGGDEFVVLCDPHPEGADPLDIACRIEAELEEPFTVRGQEIHIGVSTGIAFADPTSSDPGAVLRDADTAMYEAKSAGRGRWVVFDDHLRRRAVDRQETENALRRSRHGENLELRYQPVFDLNSRKLVGFEALLRWWHLGELISPKRFVPVAEETGLIVPIGEWVLAEATRQARIWQDLPGFEDLGMSVNVSARQIQRPDFLSTMARRSVPDITPGSLTVEITESVVLEETVSTAAVLAGLRDLGVQVAVDDFGTGYSSLTYLHRLPFDVVKLDRSFVAGVTDSAQKRAIVTAVLGLTSALGLCSIAEGIETESQLAELTGLGCDYGQGHLVAGAMSAEMVTDLLAKSWAGRELPAS